ncbi:MAG: pyrroline-5-carboxylate reductase [Legionella sp. 40-6]|nr:MAG: pyrroline-5-carboxylate reductase [Legionella sp. 40-6]
MIAIRPYISIIGTGHLASALLRGWILRGVSADKFIISNRSKDKLKHLQNTLHVSVAVDNCAAATAAPILILGIKPQYMEEVCKELKEIVQEKKPLIISLAAVTEIKDLSEWFGVPGLPVVRAMTNTPTEFGKGTTALYANAQVSEAQKKELSALFSQVGYSFWVEKEELLDPLTAAIGSAPAYFLLCMEAMQKAAIAQGIPETIAKKITFNVAAGTAALAEHSQADLSALRKGITTPQGVTEFSLKNFPLDEFIDAFRMVYHAADERIRQLKN